MGTFFVTLYESILCSKSDYSLSSPSIQQSEQTGIPLDVKYVGTPTLSHLSQTSVYIKYLFSLRRFLGQMRPIIQLSCHVSRTRKKAAVANLCLTQAPVT